MIILRRKKKLCSMKRKLTGEKVDFRKYLKNLDALSVGVVLFVKIPLFLKA